MTGVLPIITADQRLAAPRGIKGCIFGPTFDSALSAGTVITAGFEFDVPVRFDTDTLDVTLDIERLGSITSIPLLEIRR